MLNPFEIHALKGSVSRISTDRSLLKSTKNLPTVSMKQLPCPRCQRLRGHDIRINNDYCKHEFCENLCEMENIFNIVVAYSYTV